MKYEIMFIVRPNLEDADLKKVVKGFEDVFTKNGAKIESSKDMGSRELAYDISSKDNKASKEFTRLANLSEDIIRHITIKL